MNAEQVKAVFGSMKTAFPDSLKTVVFSGKTATGIVPTSSFPSFMSALGEEQGTSSERVVVDADDLDRPGSGAEITVDGNLAIADEAHDDPTGALRMISYHYQKPVVNDPQEIG